MERYGSTDQRPQRVVAPTEEEEESQYLLFINKTYVDVMETSCSILILN
jgi:hypothetical protein